MNFFGVLISDAQFDAAMDMARKAIRSDLDTDVFEYEAAIMKALGFGPGEVDPQALRGPYRGASNDIP